MRGAAHWGRQQRGWSAAPGAVAAVAAAPACTRRTCALPCCVSQATPGVVDMAVQRREGLPAAAPFASLQQARASRQPGAATGLLAYPRHNEHMLL